MSRVDSARAVAADSRGLAYGDGLFETIAVADGKPRLWDRHLARLQNGCRRLRIPPPDPESLYTEVAGAGRNGVRSVVKVLVARGGPASGYRHEAAAPAEWRVLSRTWPPDLDSARQSGVTVRWCEMRLARQPRLAGIKHLNRLEQVLARAEWQDEYAEGLMRDTEGFVIEGTMSNLFLVAKGTLVTPDLSQSGVAGVMRAEVIAQAGRLGISVSQQAVSVDMVEQAEELFLTNSLIGIWPVARLEARRYAVVGPTTQTLQAALHAHHALA